MNRSRNRFEGKGVVVTGAAQGIGRAVAKAFAAEGAGLIMLDNEGDVLASTVDAIRGTGADVEAVVGDVSRREDVRRAVERAVERFGRLDAAVQVAGIADFVPFLEFTDESWDKILNVNLRGTWYLVQEAARAMVGAGTRGAIVVTASTNAFQPEAGGLAYNTSKSPGRGDAHRCAGAVAPRHPGQRPRAGHHQHSALGIRHQPPGAVEGVPGPHPDRSLRGAGGDGAADPMDVLR